MAVAKAPAGLDERSPCRPVAAASVVETPGLLEGPYGLLCGNAIGPGMAGDLEPDSR